MRAYTVANTAASLAQNRGVEIMASSFDEARDKAEVLGVPCRVVPNYTPMAARDTWGDGFYSITDGIETRDVACEFVSEAIIEIGEEGPELL